MYVVILVCVCVCVCLSYSFILLFIKHIYAEYLLCVRHLDNSGLWASVKLILSNIKIISSLEIKFDLGILGGNLNYQLPLSPSFFYCKCCFRQMYNVDSASKK